MPPWPTLPPPPPGPISDTGRDVLNTIQQIAAVPPGSPTVLWAQKATDLQAIIAASYKALTRMVADAQPADRTTTHPGVLTLTELENITGWSRSTVRRVIRHGRDQQEEE